MEPNGSLPVQEPTHTKNLWALGAIGSSRSSPAHTPRPGAGTRQHKGPAPPGSGTAAVTSATGTHGVLPQGPAAQREHTAAPGTQGPAASPPLPSRPAPAAPHSPAGGRRQGRPGPAGCAAGSGAVWESRRPGSAAGSSGNTRRLRGHTAPPPALPFLPVPLPQPRTHPRAGEARIGPVPQDVPLEAGRSGSHGRRGFRAAIGNSAVPALFLGVFRRERGSASAGAARRIKFCFVHTRVSGL
ncbi:translation initiation factor IF-2-like [Passer montanus]|uniref:translation initiation factor IF-2-like n=1 Tax=Passer montanus TaxID=9160 RepID=UPI00195F2C03|nr:translation initiation factor IF-2-like [Passer montanus]